MKKNIILLLNLLTKNEKNKLPYFILLTIFLVLIESVSIGLIVPIISVILDQSNKINLMISSYFGIGDSGGQLVNVLVFFFIFLYVIKSLYLLFYNWYLIKFSNLIQVRLSTTLLDNYLSLIYIDFIKRNSAELIRNIVAECAKTRNILRNIIFLGSEIFVLLGIIVLIMFIDLEAAISAFLVVTISSLIYLLIVKKKVHKIGEEQVELSKVLLKSVIQKISSYKFINIIDKKIFFLKEFENDIIDTTENNLKASIINILPRIWIEIAGITCLGIFILYLTSTDYDSGRIITTTGLLAFASMRIFPSISKITMSLQSLKYSSATLEKVSIDLDLNKFSSNIFKDSKILRFDKEVIFRNVDFSFNENQNDVLDNIKFSIKKGESIFIKGESGSGKSTLANIISGLIVPDKGSILVDNKEHDLIKDRVRLDAGFVHQETYLIDDTIERNIAIGHKLEDIDHEKLKKVIRQSQLEELVNQLPSGIKTTVGEKGSQISAGQAQRIGIARTLYHDPDLIIFDEATSALDQENAIQIINTINQLKINKSIIFISHDTNYQEKFDKILEIKNKNLYLK